ncbi:MAG: hypothetical protein ACREQM_06445 [Candidatus Dormibacteraceae bacterium]
MSTTPPDNELSSPDVAAPEYLAQAVVAAESATSGLVDGAPPAWRKDAYKVILGGILQDAVDNGTSPPDDQDIANLRGFVKAASAAALAAPADLRDDTFTVILQTLTDDWVVNWDALPDDLLELEEEDDEEDADEEEDEDPED